MVKSSSAKKACNFLRKRRKWPLSPYKAKWHETFNQLQAMQSLKNSSSEQPQNKPHLLHSLVNSFSIYNCDPTPHAYHFVIKTLTQTTSQFHHLNPVLDRLEKIENLETPEYIFVDLIQIYGNANMIDEAISIFFRMRSFRCVPTVYSLNTLLFLLCRNREWIVKVPEILLKSQYMNIRFEESSLRILITALCRMKKASYAIKLLNCMLSDGYTVDFRVCSTILSSLCGRNDLSVFEVMGFLEDMRKLGFVPGMVDCGNVIKFLVKEGRSVDALGVLNRMKSDRIKPDIVCYTMVLKGVILDGDYEMADELFDEMLVLGLVPDIHTYNVYIKGLCKQKNVEAGYKMLGHIKELGCKPDLITYNALLEGFCKDGELSRARELVSEMGLKGVGLNSQSYRIMIDGTVSKGDIFEACVLFEEMLDKYHCPRSSTIDKIICGLCERSLFHKGLQLLGKMVDKSVAPGTAGWEALLLSLGSKLGEERKLKFADAYYRARASYDTGKGPPAMCEQIQVLWIEEVKFSSKMLDINNYDSEVWLIK